MRLCSVMAGILFGPTMATAGPLLSAVQIKGDPSSTKLEVIRKALAVFEVACPLLGQEFSTVAGVEAEGQSGMSGYRLEQYGWRE